MSNASPNELGFRESVELMFNRAASFMDVSDKLIEKIRVCNATYIVRFGVKLRGDVHTFTGFRSVHSEHKEPIWEPENAKWRGWPMNIGVLIMRI